MKYASFGLALLAFGCNDEGSSSDDPTDSGPVGDVALVQTIDWNCDQTSWTFTNRTDGLASKVVVQVFHSGAWDGIDTSPSVEDAWRETHQVFNTAVADDESWFEYEAVLGKVADPSQVIEGQSTWFECGRHGADELAFAVQVLDANDDVYDCAMWGHRSSDWYETIQGEDCLCFEPELDGGCGDHSTL